MLSFPSAITRSLLRQPNSQCRCHTPQLLASKISTSSTGWNSVPFPTVIAAFCALVTILFLRGRCDVRRRYIFLPSPAFIPGSSCLANSIPNTDTTYLSTLNHSCIPRKSVTLIIMHFTFTNSNRLSLISRTHKMLLTPYSITCSPRDLQPRTHNCTSSTRQGSNPGTAAADLLPHLQAGLR